MEMLCIQCGVQFFPDPRVAAKAKFCSRECGQLHIKAERQRLKPTLECEWCGVEFKPVRYTQGRTRFCSRQCKIKSANSTDKHRLAVLKCYYERRYDLTLEEVADMRAGGCGICGATAFIGRWNQAHIDHDWETGEVRGLLCHSHNVGLGHFNHDPKLLRAAAEYLERHGKS